MNHAHPRPCLAAAALALASAPASAPAAAATDEVTAEQVVAAIEGAFGVTAGQRRNHTKGTCASGEFVGMTETSRYSRSPLFSGKTVPVIARFSLAGGNPKAPDTARSPRGMALELALPGGELQHMTMLNVPVFGAAHPRTFLDLMLALKPDPATGKPDPEKLKAFRAAHADSAAQADYLARHNPPPSYAATAYWGIHTFRFIDAGNRITPVRWRFVPEQGERRLSDQQMKSAPADFLEQELIDRLRRGSARWDMVVTLGEAGDTETDPTVAWPASRRQMHAGTLTLSMATPQKGAPCERINFDPLVMGDGIVPSDDPVLRFRSPAYAASFAKRLSGR